VKHGSFRNASRTHVLLVSVCLLAAVAVPASAAGRARATISAGHLALSTVKVAAHADHVRIALTGAAHCTRASSTKTTCLLPLLPNSYCQVDLSSPQGGARTGSLSCGSLTFTWAWGTSFSYASSHSPPQLSHEKLLGKVPRTS
jgi:hypothetical protein